MSKGINDDGKMEANHRGKDEYNYGNISIMLTGENNGKNKNRLIKESLYLNLVNTRKKKLFN